MKVVKSFVISTAILVLCSAFELFVFCRIGARNLDRMAIFMMISYIIVMILRFVSLLFHQIFDSSVDPEHIPPYQQYFDTIMPIVLNDCEMIVWISLSLFVFQLQTIKNRLTSEGIE